MRITHPRLAVAMLAAACVLSLAGCAGASPSRDSTARRADADQIALQALRTWAVERNPTEAARAAGQAALAAPERADLAWLHLRLCTQAPRCEPQPLEARLRKLAPENGVVWLSVLSRSQAQRDEQAAEQILAAMGRAQRFDLYWTALVWRMTGALHASRPQPRGEAGAPLTAALNDVTGWLSRLVTPAFEPVSEACSARRVLEPSRRAQCAGVAEALQRSDAYVAEGVGLGVAQRIAADGSGEANLVQERIAALAYRNRTAAAVMAGQIEREKFSAEVLELMKQLPREQDVSLAILRWARQPVNP